MREEEDFLRDDYFSPNYLPEGTDIKKVTEERKGVWKEIYGFIHSCNKAGRSWSQTDVTNLCEMHLVSKKKVEDAFKNIYEKHNDEHGIDSKLPIEKLKLFLKKNYNLYRNTLTDILMNGDKELNRNDIIIDLEHTGMKYSSEKINSYLDSTYIEQRDPIKHYFENLPEWDSVDHIKNLCSFVSSDDPEYFNSMLKKHMVRSIECSLDYKHNRYVFVFSGSKQNIGKSSFISWINPFGKLYIAQGLPRNDKDAIISLTENFIINLDELAGMSKININKAKSLISQSVVRERRSHAKNSKTMLRRANFWATTNENDFLLDTSNTRWIVFEVNEIDWKGYTSSVEVNKIWSQAYHLYKDKNWSSALTAEESKKQSNKNKGFESNDIEKELIKIHFKPNGNNRVFYSKPDIIDQLQQNTTVKLNSRFIAKMMRQLGFEEKIKKINNHVLRGFMAEKIKGKVKNIEDGEENKLF